MIDGLKPYPKYKDSGVEWLGKVPEHWEVLPGRTVFREINDRGHPDEQMLSVTITRGVLRQADLLADSSKKDSSNEDKSNYKLVQPGDLVYNKMRAWQGAVGVSDYRGIVSPAYIVQRLRNHKNFSRYIHYLLRTPSFTTEAERWSYGITSDQWSLRAEDFKNIYFSVPSADEQTAIIRFLDWAERRIRRVIRARKRRIKLLEEWRETETEDALRHSKKRVRIGIVADKIERLVDRQDDIRYTPIGLYNHGRGIFHKPPTLGAELGDSTFFWVEEGDLVISGQFAWEGAVALADRKDHGCIASHRYPILRGKQGVLNSAFLLSFLKTGWGSLLLDHHSRGAAGRNRPLNVTTLMKEKIPVPPLDVQERIAHLVRLEAETRDAVASEVVLLREFRTRLIADVVTGKLDVREAAASLPNELEPDNEIDATESDENVDTFGSETPETV